MTEAKRIDLSAEQFAHLGGGEVAYIREIGSTDAVKLLGPRIAVPKEAKLFCLYNADGSPVSISGSLEAAAANAFHHELKTVSVH